METLNQVLKVLFEETRSEDVIDAYLDKRVKYVGIGRFVDERIFCQQMVRVNGTYIRSSRSPLSCSF